MLTTSEFKKKYMKVENWKRVIFRNGAPETTGFLLDNTFGALRIHCGRDRGPGGIWAPFDVSRAVYKENYKSFGGMLFLDIEGTDFQVRIGHMRWSDIAPNVQEKILRGDPIPAGTYLGRAGNAGVSVGPGGGHHTHTEVVSSGEQSEICEELLNEDYSEEELSQGISSGEVVAYADSVGLPKEKALEDCREQRQGKRVLFANRFLIRRLDYDTGERRTFYNPDLLFNI